MTIKIMLVAGELSGDTLGSSLINSIKKISKEHIQFFGVGGPKMQDSGLKSVLPFEDFSVMGFYEILPKIPRFLNHLKTLENLVSTVKPHALITIDSPDFNFRLAERLCSKDFPIMHYVAPSVWAWRPARAKKISKYYDHLFAILPFEPPLFQIHGLETTFVGHPNIPRKIKTYSPTFKDKYNIESKNKILLLLPGSRINEIKRLFSIFFTSAQNFIKNNNDFRIIVMTDKKNKQKILSNFSFSEFNDYEKPIFIDDDEKHDIFECTDIAIASSGTVTLEIALYGIPAVVGYKMNFITYIIAKNLVNLNWVSLPNIILKKEIYPEFIQSKCSIQNISDALFKLNSLDDIKFDFKKEFSLLREKFQLPKSAGTDLAAEIVLNKIKKT